MAELYDKTYKQGTKKFMDATKEGVAAYNAYKKELMSNSPFDKKTNELLLLAVSCAIQCAYCIDTHGKKAKALGASDKEIAFTIQAAATIKHGATIAYGVNALG